MIRLLFLFHRYLGIAVGVLMAMWCVSGVVMLYVSYPALDESSRLSNLAAINWSACCKISAELLRDAEPVSVFRIEMLADRPVLYLGAAPESAGLIDLITGSAIHGVSPDQAATVAAAYAKAVPPETPRLTDAVDYDQWTVSGSDADRPLYRFRLGDSARTELYVSSTTGQAVQITTGRERFWNWLGSVPHWLYFAELRRRVTLWSQVVIVTSLLGCFLAVTGLYIGVRQLLRQPAGRYSPYDGFNLWHHVAGLVFGVFTLTWVLSGLLSMNPWGLLEGAGAQPERARLRGPPVSGAQVRSALQALVRAHPSGIASIQNAPLGGQLYFLASAADGERWRLDATAAPVALNEANLTYIGAALVGTEPPQSPQLMRREDTYYFGHHREVVQLPAYRFVTRNGSGTRYYVDPVSGALIAKIDRGDQHYRWWHEGLHRMDFSAALRGRPQWDVLMLLLMSGVTTVCVTGAYLGYRRLVRS